MPNDTTVQSLFDHAKKPAKDPSIGAYPKIFATYVEHYANLHPSGDASADLVNYAHGELKLSSNQQTLSGEFQLWGNKFNPEKPAFFNDPAVPADAFADVDSLVTLFVSVTNAGQTSLQKKLDGTPIGNMPPALMNAAYNGGLVVEQWAGFVRSLSFTLA